MKYTEITVAGERDGRKAHLSRVGNQVVVKVAAGPESQAVSYDHDRRDVEAYVAHQVIAKTLDGEDRAHATAPSYLHALGLLAR